MPFRIFSSLFSPKCGRARIAAGARRLLEVGDGADAELVVERLDHLRADALDRR